MHNISEFTCGSSGRRSRLTPSAHNIFSPRPASATAYGRRSRHSRRQWPLLSASLETTMDIKSVLSPANVLLDVSVSDKARLLQMLSDRAASALNLPADRI